MTDLMWEGDAFSDYMADKQASHGARTALGPSAASKCYRQAAYEYLQVEPSDVRGTDAADLGTLLHLGWSALIRSRFDPAHREPDVSLQASGMPRPGSADDVDYLNRVVTDLKSAKARVYESWLRSGPYESYWEQVEVYALALRERHGGDWTLRILAFNRETGEHTEFERAADPENGRAIVDRIAERHAALSAARDTFGLIAEDRREVAEQFPREGKGPGRGMPCDWCPWLSACWPSPTGPDGTPQSATIDPDDDAAVAAFARDYLDAAAAEKKAKAAKRDAQVFLAGVDRDVPDPTDPGFVLTVHPTGGNPGAPEYDCEAMAARLEELGFAPIMRETTTARYTRVGRKRAPRRRGA